MTRLDTCSRGCQDRLCIEPPGGDGERKEEASILFSCFPTLLGQTGRLRVRTAVSGKMDGNKEKKKVFFSVLREHFDKTSNIQ